jgi:hypothetical protein
MTGSNRLCHAAFSPRPLASITRSSLFKDQFLPVQQRLRPVSTIAQSHFLFIFAICHDATYIPPPACSCVRTFPEGFAEWVCGPVQRWALSRSIVEEVFARRWRTKDGSSSLPAQQAKQEEDCGDRNNRGTEREIQRYPTNGQVRIKPTNRESDGHR